MGMKMFVCGLLESQRRSMSKGCKNFVNSERVAKVGGVEDCPT